MSRRGNKVAIRAAKEHAGGRSHGTRARLERKRRWEFRQPGFEDFQLIFRRIEELYAHAQSLEDIDDFALGLESAVIAGDSHVEHGSHRESVQTVHVTTVVADFRDPAGKMHGACGIGQLRRGDKGVAGNRATFTMRRGRIAPRIVGITQGQNLAGRVHPGLSFGVSPSRESLDLLPLGVNGRSR